MVPPLVNYFYERRRGLAKTAGIAGGVYVLSGYIRQRLEDMREQMLEDRSARENLRRRFEQNQQDAAYMILGLLPTLADQVLEGMDVEALTRELAAARAPRAASAAPSSASRSPARAPLPIPPPDPPLSDDAGSESALGASVSVISITGPDDAQAGEAPPGADATATGHAAQVEDLSQSSASWVEAGASQTGSGAPSTSSRLAPPNGANEDLSSSVISLAGSDRSAASSSAPSRSKAELWREVKMLTFTRTLTALYASALLALFTRVQLALLGRRKYVQSVVQLAREERARDAFAHDGLPGLSLFGDALDPALRLAVGPEDAIGDEDGEGTDDLDPETERKFLTLSWWLLHVGWKDIGERVRRGVEEVFEGVSLKEQLGPRDIHRMIGDVRRRVEHEVTFEGAERCVSFLSALLPPTPETLNHVLERAGLRVAPPAHLGLPPVELGAGAPPPRDAAFDALLAETLAALSAPGFARALAAALDAGADTLVQGLLASAFGAGPDGAAPADVPTTPLARLLPGLARWSRLALTGLPNELVDRVCETREARAFSVTLFSLFEDQFR